MSPLPPQEQRGQQGMTHKELKEIREMYLSPVFKVSLVGTQK